MNQVKIRKLKNQNYLPSTETALTQNINKEQVGKFEQLLSVIPFFSKSSKKQITVLRLCGVIGKASSMKSGLSIESVNELIEKAFENPKTCAVCLAVNSPGGSPVQSELIASRIINLSKEKEIPVYTFVEDVAASGGYWLACAGREIYVSKASILGSIGVISSGFGFQDAINKLGIERRVYSEGKNKSILDPFQPAKAGDVKIIKQLQKQIHEHFINYIKERRAGKLTQDDEILFNGEFWAGQTAVDFGLADGIDDMYSFIKRNFGDEVKIEYIASKQPWLKRKLGMTKTTIDNFPEDIANALLNSLENKITETPFRLK